MRADTLEVGKWVFLFMRRPVYKVRLIALVNLPQKRRTGRAASRGKIAPTRLVKRTDMAEGMREYGKDSGDRETGF